MKILIGICGIGKGHCIREYEIAKELIRRGHKVKILTYNEGINFFKDTGIDTYNVYVPMILFKNGKFDWIDIIKRNIFKFLPGTIKNIKVFRKLKEECFIPDLCISDYEPVVSRIAYKLKKPFINIDQHSKFIYMKEESIDGYSCDEEKNRLTLFFPSCDYKYIVSFYKLPTELLPKNVEILYPVIRSDLTQMIVPEKKQKKVLVYFSKYIDISIRQTMEEVIKIFNNFNEYQFTIYSTEYYDKNCEKGKNVVIKPNERKQFVEDLSTSLCVISTAGHTLISEALFCGIPLFLLPLPTFDQHYCGKFVKENKIGYSSDEITVENLKEFLSNLENYKENIKKCENLVKPMNTTNYIADKLEKYNKN